jgi:hypothetical protein
MANGKLVSNQSRSVSINPSEYIGRWAVVGKSAWKSNFVATPWGIDFLWFNAQYHRCPIPQKVPKQKTCQTLRKWVISDYPLLNCITAKKCEILYSITAKMTSIIGKLTKNWI